MATSTKYRTVNGMLISVKEGSNSKLNLVPNGRGDVVAAIDQGGTVQHAGRWAPYGTRLATSGAPLHAGFVGALGYRLAEPLRAGYYVRARVFDPSTGRWITVDPLWPMENAYGYVRGNPTTYVDPTGFQTSAIDLRPMLCRIYPHCPEIDIGGGALWKPNGCGGTWPHDCPYQDAAGEINLGGFRTGPNPGGRSPLGSREYEKYTCDPRRINKDALKKRIDDVTAQINVMAGKDPKQSIRGSSDDYAPWAATEACCDSHTGYTVVFAKTRCKPYMFSELPRAYFGDSPKDYTGLGCLYYCLLKHEQVHKNAILSGEINQGTYGAELNAWRAELECLNSMISSNAPAKISGSKEATR